MTDLYSHLDHANDLEPSVGHHHLIDHAPLHREDAHEPPFYVLSRYDDVFAVLTSPELWNNGDGSGVFFQPGGVLGSADGEVHRRQRKVLQDGFRPSAIEAISARIERIGTELWERAFAADGEGDFVRLFAFPFPAIVIADLLGVPADERDHFGHWSDEIVAGLGGGDLSRVDAANASMFELVDRLVELRLAAMDDGGTPPDDMLTVMARAVRDGALQRGEVRRLSTQLLIAGHETTAGLISLMLYRLIERPDLVDRLRADPDLIAPAVEEFLRFDSPVQGLFRTNAHECPLHGSVIPPRTKLQVLFAAANRDPAVWDDPDEIRLERFATPGRPHLALGWGTHHCIGAPLARREGQLALRLIVDRFDSVELVGDVSVNEPFILRALTTMPIRWTVRSGRG